MQDTESKKAQIAERLRMAREFAGLSQSQVAKMLNLSRPSVSEMEAGRRRVSAEEITQLADIYDVNIAWLTGESSLTSEEVTAKVELAARELSKLKQEDVDKLLELLKTLRSS